MENLPEQSEKIKEKVCISQSQNGKYKGFYNKDFSTFTNNKENKESDRTTTLSEKVIIQSASVSASLTRLSKGGFIGNDEGIRLDKLVPWQASIGSLKL